ncbi:MAG: hypothetical protein HYZ52_00275 [Candidatus Omnitrophica bacterium]|nr:hypothetical protein [Candidatus Omnitrophota bacterium]
MEAELTLFHWKCATPFTVTQPLFSVSVSQDFVPNSLILLSTALAFSRKGSVRGSLTKPALTKNLPQAALTVFQKSASRAGEEGLISFL